MTATRDEMVEVVRKAQNQLIEDGDCLCPDCVAHSAVDALTKHFATCGECGGRGTVRSHADSFNKNAEARCPSCNGSGIRPPVDRYRFIGLEP